MRDGERAAVGRCIRPRGIHVARVEHVLGRWTEERDVEAELRRDDQRRVRDRGVERLRVVGPGQEELLAVRRAEPLLERERERELLTGMRDRLHVQDGDGGVLREGVDDGVLAIVLPALELGERAHRDEVAIAREHARDLLDVLLGLAVHDDAVAVLDGPGALAGLEDDGVAAHLEHADLERRASPQRRIEEDERDALAREVSGAGGRRGPPGRLELASVIEQLLELCPRPVERGQEVAWRGGIADPHNHAAPRRKGTRVNVLAGKAQPVMVAVTRGRRGTATPRRSRWAAAARTVASSQASPTSCRPTGRPGASHRRGPMPPAGPSGCP